MQIIKVVADILMALLLFIYFLLPSIKEILRYIRVKNKKEVGVSKIVSFTQYTEPEGLIRYRYFVEYIVENKIYRHEFLKTGFGVPIIGQVVNIIYDKENPEKIYLNSKEDFFAILVNLFLSLGAVILVLYFLYTTIFG